MAASDDSDEDGRRLIRPETSAALSLSQRLAHRIDRLVWKTPLHHLRLRGRPPLQLLAVPHDPVKGDKQAGFAILEGRIELAREEIDLETLDFAKLAVSPALTDHVHSFAWLRDLNAAGHRTEAVPIAQFILGRWLLCHARAISDPAWRPDLCGQRVLFWASYAPILMSDDVAFRRNILNTLHRTARHLEATAARTPVGLPRMQALAGLVASGLLVSGGDTELDRAEAQFARAVELSIHPDGGIVSRSPADQLALVETLAMLRAAYQAVRGDTATIGPLLDRVTAAAEGVTLGDGRLSTWQGGRPLPTARILAAGRGDRDPAPLLQAAEWGYQRMIAGTAVVVLDAAPPPSVALPAGGCASTLAFEMSDGAHRLIVNCGRTDAFGAELGQGLRSTAAHSALVLADSNSTAIHPDGSLGRGVSEVEVERQETEMGTRIDATHQGYARRFGFIHERQLALRTDGRELRGDDVLTPAGHKRRAPETSASARFHLAPGIEVTPTADGLGALLRTSGGPVWQFRCRGGELIIEDSLWVDGTGTPKPSVQLVVAAAIPAEGATISWMLRRAT